MIALFSLSMNSLPAIFATPVRPAEVAELSELAEEIWRECYAELLSTAQIDYMLEWMYAPDHLRDEMESQGIEYFWLMLPAGAGHAGQRTCGFLAFGSGENADEIFLHKLYVHFEHRGRGVGAAAMAWLEEQGRRRTGRRFSKVRLRVNRGNAPAIRAYQRAGFQIVDELCSDIGGGYVMDDFVMVKEVR